MNIIAKKEIIEVPTNNCHASTVLPLNDGTVLAAWFGGTKEGKDDVDIYVTKRSVDGVWSEPVVISVDKDVPHWNPVLFETKDSKIYLFFKFGKSINLVWKTMVCFSTDNGDTWSDPKELVEGDTSGGRGPVKNKAIYISNGDILAPASHEPNPEWHAFVDISTDDGKTWTKTKYVPDGKGEDHVPVIQPTLWESEEGKVHMLLRSAKGKIYKSDSEDFGRTWCPIYDTGLPNPNSGIDCVKTSDGKVMLVYNPAGGNWGDRTPLVLAQSEDNGKTWEDILTLEEAEVGREEDVEYSYPAITEKDGVLHITYTYNRVKIAYWQVSFK